MRRLAVLIAAAGLLVWAAGPALSAQAYVPRAVDFEQALDPGGSGAARSAASGWRSPVVRAPRRFDLVGLRWTARGEVTARIRVRTPAGRWSRWIEMGEGHGVRGTDPLWTGGADAYQLRLDRRPRGLRAHFVNTTGTATRADRVRTALRRAVRGAVVALAGAPARAQSASGAPEIVPRAAWGADQCPPGGTPEYGRVDVGMVHHTVSVNEYAPEDSAAIVLAMCRYHRYSNRWKDIGYNFVVDRFGRVFEGRAGGIDQAVVGAQAQGYNAVSTGVANVGTFTNVPQTAEGVRATADVLAWKLSLHGAPVQGTVAVRSGGGDVNRYPSGSDVTFQRISGHRDADRTECPGDLLYAQLPEIRRQAAARAPALAPVAANGLTLEVADRTLEYPQPAQASGRLGGLDGAGVGGARVAIQIAGGTGFRAVAAATTGDDGRWSAALPTAYTRTVRAVADTPAGVRVTSPSVRVQVAPRIRARAAGPRVVVRRALTVSGSMRPHRGRLRLEVARPGSDERMHVVARLAVKVRGGRFTARVRLRRPALHRLRIAFAPDQRNGRGRSRELYVRAVRPRSATGGARAR